MQHQPPIIHEPRIIRIGPDDVPHAESLHRRCSPHTLWSRYHRAMGDPRTYLRTLLSRPGSVHLAARDTTGRLVALGHLMPDRDDAEAALLVEDAWQNGGLGTRLLLRLGAHAVRQGRREVYGLVLPGDARIAAILRHAAIPVDRVQDGGVTTLRASTRDIAAVVRAGRGRFAAPRPLAAPGTRRRAAGHFPFVIRKP